MSAICGEFLGALGVLVVQSGGDVASLCSPCSAPRSNFLRTPHAAPSYLHHESSGESLYIGAPLLLFLLIVSPWLTNRWLLRAKNFLASIAAALILMACPPVPLYAYAAFIAFFILWLLLHGTEKRPLFIVHRIAAVLLSTLCLLIPASEWPHRSLPRITAERTDHLTVIGDSISAGIDPRSQPWTSTFTQITGTPVKNLSKPGAQVSDSLDMAVKLTPDDRLVLLEIGGNDLIANVPSADFARDLEALLAKIQSPTRTLIMFELPLLPHKIAYGQIQRSLAQTYHVTLIPKRFFIEVLAANDATSDGLHLSQPGATKMAFLATALQDVIAPPHAPLAPPASMHQEVFHLL